MNKTYSTHCYRYQSACHESNARGMFIGHPEPTRSTGGCVRYAPSESNRDWIGFKPIFSANWNRRACGTGPEDRTLLGHLVRVMQSPDCEPRVVGMEGLEPTTSGTRNQWPTNGLHPGGSTQNRTEIVGFKDRCPTIGRCSSSRSERTRTSAQILMRDRYYPEYAALVAGA